MNLTPKKKGVFFKRPQLSDNNHHNKILLSVNHLDEKQKIEAAYAHDLAADPKNIARQIIMEMDGDEGESGTMGGIFFNRVDYNLHPSGAYTTSFHAHMEGGRLMVGVEEVTNEHNEFDGVRVSLFNDVDHNPSRRR